MYHVQNTYKCHSHKNDLPICMPASVCVCVHACMCMHVCVCVEMHLCMYMCQPEDNMDCHFSALSILVFRTRSLPGIEFTKQARLAGQWAPLLGIQVSHYHACLSVFLGIELSSSCLQTWTLLIQASPRPLHSKYTVFTECRASQTTLRPTI